MNIEKKVLAELDGVYAVSQFEFNGKKSFLAATEKHGSCLLFSPPYWEASEVLSGPGGAMSLVGIPQEKDAFLAIQEFFPIFLSEDACIVRVNYDWSMKQWHVKRVLDLPFVHRIELVGMGQNRYIVASSLCKGKEYQEDWSQPGAVYVGSIPENIEDNWSLQPLIEGITKNHGMYTTVIDQEQVVFVSGQEGVFAIKPPNAVTKRWTYKRLIDHEVSDVYLSDLDNDGSNEIITIEAFHGNSLNIYKQFKERWECVYNTSINFGHAIWSGKILNESVIIIGNRGGAKELIMLFPTGGDIQNMRRLVIEEGVGATQVAVMNRPGKTLILSANHAKGEVALYTLTK